MSSIDTHYPFSHASTCLQYTPVITVFLYYTFYNCYSDNYLGGGGGGVGLSKMIGVLSKIYSAAEAF